MNKTDWALAWFGIPTDQDFTNLIASGARKVLIGYQVAHTQPNVLARLLGLGIRITVRIDQENQQAPADIAQGLSAISHIVPIDGVILGCEPDAGVDLRYGSSTWGQDKAYQSIERVNYLIQAVHGLGLQAISPAFSDPPDQISEDGAPRPGRTTWLEICRPMYNRADGCAGHVYSLGWAFSGREAADVVKTNHDRLKFTVKDLVEVWHKPVWIDEVGVILNGTDTDKIVAYIEMAQIIMASACNGRVVFYSPFLSVGTPNGTWSPRYLIRDLAAYQRLGRWLSQP